MTGTGAHGAVTLRWGGTSDVGQVREVNEDSMLAGPLLFVVADGMGGHAAGDVASSLAVETITAQVPAPADGLRVLDLVTAVQSANEAVYDRSGTEPDLAGMGTTVVAIAVVVEGGEQRVAIVNVGDSRAYRLSGGELQQVSDDHSLVGELVRNGELTRDEAQIHPQRNIVTRAVGIDEHVEVDEFQVLPHTGDRYLLCSDGLTDEVTEGDIARVLRTMGDPDEAAAELVRLANEHGGRDNITVVIVDVVDDGLDPAASAGAHESVPDDEHFSHDPDQDTQQFLALPDDQAHRQRELAHAAASTDGDTVAPATVAPDTVAPETAKRETGDGGSGRAPRAITFRSLAFVVAVLVLIVGGGALAYNYARNTYFVGVEDRSVAIFRGRPDGVLWIDPTLVEITDIEVADVPGDVRDDLEAGVSHASLADALRYVDNLEQRIEDLRPPVTTTTTTVLEPSPVDPDASTTTSRPRVTTTTAG